MGLFNKKTPCAICGGKVSALFPWKIDNQLVCNDCYGDVDLPDEAMGSMTIEKFKEYMAFRKENALLKQRFVTTRKVDFGWWDNKFLFDMENRLLCMDKKLEKTVFEGGQIKSFEIREDRMPLFRGGADGLVCHTSAVPERVMAMVPQIEQLKVQIQMKHEIEDMLDRRNDDNNNHRYHPISTITIPVPFQKFYVEICFNHPYWSIFTAEMTAPEFDNTVPDVNDYLEHYNQDAMLMEELARALMELAFPGAPERTAPSPGAKSADSTGDTVPGKAVDTVEELRRYKDLMDKGIITEDEFTAKKRQLLGI